MTSRLKITNKQEQEICRLYEEEGLATTAIGKVLKISKNSVIKIITRNGYKLRSKGGQRKLTDEQELEICRLYIEEKLPPAKLAKLFEVGESTINAALKRNGVKLRDLSEAKKGRPCLKGRRFSEQQELVICQRYKEGESTPTIAKAFKTQSGLICKILKRNGVKLRSISEATKGKPYPQGRRFSKHQEQTICQRYLAGESATALAKTFKASSTTICNILDRNGIERRASGIEFGDSVQHVFDGTGRHQHQRECELYLFELARYSDTHCKAGIAFDTDVRAGISSGEYGEEVLRLFFASRAEAYFLEQAVLDATRGSASCPADLAGWVGHSEVRMMPAEDMVPTILRLAEELEELGQWEFAARYVPMTASQRAICQQRAMELVAK